MQKHYQPCLVRQWVRLVNNDIKQYIQNYAIEALMNSPVGVQISRAMDFVEKAQNNLYALYGKKDEAELIQIKVGTILVLAVLRKIADGKMPKDFETLDWEDIAKAVSEYAVIKSNEAYTVFVFDLYERYIRFSAEQLRAVQTDVKVAAVLSLADELGCKKELFSKMSITETQYIEDCMWICLEAMIKMLSMLTGNNELGELTQAVGSFAFEYARLRIYKYQLNAVEELLDYQAQVDDSLKARRIEFEAEIKKEAEEFLGLIDNAFVPDFRTAFLQSVMLAEAAGVDTNEILRNSADIDSFFMD